MPNLLNKSINYAQSYFEALTKRIIIIGEGTKIINQYPLYNTSIDSLDKVYLVTDSDDYSFPNIKNWSLKDVKTLCNILDIKLEYEGTGYVVSYDISDIKNNNKKISVVFSNNIV